MPANEMKIRQISKQEQEHLGLGKLTHLMQPTSVAYTGLQAEDRLGWGIGRILEHVVGRRQIYEYHAAKLCEGEWLLGNWVTGFSLRVSCTKI